jgi:hypothetical protein
MKKIRTFSAALMAALITFTACSDETIMNTQQNTTDEKNISDDMSADGESEAEPEEINYAPVFNVSSGFYDEAFGLEITCADENAVIYFTTDGSIPTEDSEVYTDGMLLVNKTDEDNVLSAITGVNPSGDYVPSENVIKANVIRAVAKLTDGTMSDVTSGTFFVGVDREAEYGSLPIISMYTDSDNLFDYETGIYVMGTSYDEWLEENSANQYKEGWEKEGNFTQKGREWERPAEIEYMPSDETEGFSQNVGIRIMGAASRRNSQKSFRIIAREDYGSKNIKYSLISNNEKSNGTGEVEKYKSFLLRDGGNDNDYAKLRDPFLQSLVSARSFETQQSTPCVLFIDGEYWGMYALTEDYSDNYFQNNYDIDNDNIIYIKRGEVEDGLDEDIELYNEMINFITGNDMSIDSNYEKACELLDMQGFIEYLAFNLYINNEDSFFESNNWGMWRVRETDSENEYADGKWRMVCYDTEFSLGLYNGGDGWNTNNIKKQIEKAEAAAGQAWSLGLVGSLIQNDDFQESLIVTLCDMRNLDFEKTNANEVLDSWYQLYVQGAADTFKRFGPDWIVRWNDPDEYYDSKVSEISKYINGRYDCFIGLIQSAFGLEDAATLTIDALEQSLGTIYVNSVALKENQIFSGDYFTDYTIIISIDVAEGKTLSGWNTSGCEIVEDISTGSDLTIIKVKLNGKCTLNPIIE